MSAHNTELAVYYAHKCCTERSLEELLLLFHWLVLTAMEINYNTASKLHTIIIKRTGYVTTSDKGAY